MDTTKRIGVSATTSPVSVRPDAGRDSNDEAASIRRLTSAALCAALTACAATPESGPPAAVRTRAPQGYEQTITSYFAFKVREPGKNVEVGVDKPEPSDCALDGYAASTRGWVVPAVYATRSGTVTGKDTIYINAKQYYFYFLGNSIAGVTTRMELCPGPGSSFGDAARPMAVVAVPSNGALPLLTASLEQRRVVVREQSTSTGAASTGKLAAGRKHEARHTTRKTTASAGGTRHATKKVGASRKTIADSSRKVAAARAGGA